MCFYEKIRTKYREVILTMKAVQKKLTIFIQPGTGAFLKNNVFVRFLQFL